MSRRLKLDHWFIGDNSFFISLSRFYVSISSKEEGYKLDVYVDSDVDLSLSFETIEEAVEFTEEVITKCKSVYEIKNNYQNRLVRKRTM